MSNPQDITVVHMPCRRGQDQLTVGQSCKSIRCENKSKPGDSVAKFKCIECNYEWTVPVGQSFNLV